MYHLMPEWPSSIDVIDLLHVTRGTSHFTVILLKLFHSKNGKVMHYKAKQESLDSSAFRMNSCAKLISIL